MHSLLSDKKEAWKWWDYASSFAAECTMANGRYADRSCIRAQLEKAGLEEAAVDACMGDSTADASHDLLQVCQHWRRPRLRCSALEAMDGSSTENAGCR